MTTHLNNYRTFLSNVKTSPTTQVTTTSGDFSKWSHCQGCWEYLLSWNAANDPDVYMRYADHLAYDADYEASAKCLNKDTRAEDTASYALSLIWAAQAWNNANLWSNYENAEKDGKDLFQLAVSYDQDLTTWDSYSLTNMSNMVDSNLRLANHNFYPSPIYSSVPMYASSTAAWAYTVFGNSVPTAVREDLTNRLSSTFYTSHFNSTVTPDTGLEHTALTCTSPTDRGGDCQTGGRPDFDCDYPPDDDDVPPDGCLDGQSYDKYTDDYRGPYIHMAKLWFLDGWHFVDDDKDARYEAYQAVLLLRSDSNFWPGNYRDSGLGSVNDDRYIKERVRKYTASEWANASNGEKDAWLGATVIDTERYGATAARWYIKRAYKYSLIDRAHVLPDNPLQ